MKEQRTVHDRLMAATSILQAAVLAQHSNLDGREMWGSDFMPPVALEEALRLVVSVLGDVEKI